MILGEIILMAVNCSAIGWFWIIVLISPEGLFSWYPELITRLHLPNAATKVLIECEICFSGWFALIASFLYFYSDRSLYVSIPSSIAACFVAMMLSKFYSNTFLNNI